MSQNYPDKRGSFVYCGNIVHPLHHFCYHNGMQYAIRLHEKKIAYYTLRQSRRARRMRITICYDGKMIVTVPYRVNKRLAKQFIASKSSWIQHKLAYITSLNAGAPKKISKQDYLRYKTAAELLAHQRLDYFNTMYALPYRQIAIRNQKTRWGSCSKKGNLNFNYRISLLPPHLSDYIIVHELCHLAELNHSQTFWHLVAKTIPYYAEARRELRKHGLH